MQINFIQTNEGTDLRFLHVSLTARGAGALTNFHPIVHQTKLTEVMPSH